MKKQGAEKHPKKHPTIVQQSSKMAPKIDPGGLRGPLRNQVGAQRVHNLLPEAAGSATRRFWSDTGCPQPAPNRMTFTSAGLQGSETKWGVLNQLQTG